MTTLATRPEPVDLGDGESPDLGVPVVIDGAHRTGTLKVIAWLCARALARPLLLQG